MQVTQPGSITRSHPSLRDRHGERLELTSGSDRGATPSTHHHSSRSRRCTVSTPALVHCRFRQVTSRPLSITLCSQQTSGSTSSGSDSTPWPRPSVHSTSSSGPSGGLRDGTLRHELHDSLGEDPHPGICICIFNFSTFIFFLTCLNSAIKIFCLAF